MDQYTEVKMDKIVKGVSDLSDQIDFLTKKLNSLQELAYAQSLFTAIRRTKGRII